MTNTNRKKEFLIFTKAKKNKMVRLVGYEITKKMKQTETKQISLFSENLHIIQKIKPPRKTKRKMFLYSFVARYFTEKPFKSSLECNSETEFKTEFKKKFRNATLINFNEIKNPNG